MGKNSKTEAAKDATQAGQPGADAPEQEQGAAQGQEQTPAPAQEQAPAPAQKPEPAQAPELLTLAELAAKFRLPGWHSAALHKLMGWEPGKKVTEAEYRKGMAALKNRRIGG